METKQASTIIRLIIHSKRAERKKSPCGRLVFVPATNITERHNNFQ